MVRDTSRKRKTTANLSPKPKSSKRKKEGDQTDVSRDSHAQSRQPTLHELVGIVNEFKVELKKKGNEVEELKARYAKLDAEVKAKHNKLNAEVKEKHDKLNAEVETLGRGNVDLNAHVRELNKQVETLQQKNENYVKQVVVELNEDNPEHLPELLCRFEKENKNILLYYVAFLACLIIQLGQLYLMGILMADDVIKNVTEIEKWVDEGLLDWANGTRSSYNGTGEIEFVTALRNGTLVLTDEGFSAALYNQLIGIPLLWLYLVTEINAIFFKNEYYFNFIFSDSGDSAALVVLFGQIVVAFGVAFACSQSVMTSSLDTVATIQASIEAFFVLEIDDKLLPVLWTCFQSKAFAKVKYREEATKLFEAHGLVYEWSLILAINFALCAVGRTAHDAAVFFDPTSLTPLELVGSLAWVAASVDMASWVISVCVKDIIHGMHDHGFGRFARKVYSDLRWYLFFPALLSFVAMLLSPFDEIATPFAVGAFCSSTLCFLEGRRFADHHDLMRRHFEASAICLGLALLLSNAGTTTLVQRTRNLVSCAETGDSALAACFRLKFLSPSNSTGSTLLTSILGLPTSIIPV